MLTTFGIAQESRTSVEKQKMSISKDVTPFPSKDVTVNTSKAAWDIAFTFDASAAANPGIETDGQNFYTVTWNDTTFTRYDMDGLNPVTFGVTGVTSLRDMAYDGTYFYGAAADMNLYQMDLANETLISTITVTCTGVTGIRHIAYDPTLDSGNGGFWIGNWDELGAVSMSGTELIASTATLESCYGSAYDPWTDPANPCLWLFQQPTGAEAVFYQFDINSYSFTGTTHDCSDAPGYEDSSIAGGACSYEAAGVFYLVGSIQQEPNLVVAYELATTAAETAPAAVTGLETTPDATGALTTVVHWTNSYLDVAGDALAELTLMEIFVNDEDVAEYSNNAPLIGGEETQTITVTEAGMYSFTVVGTNSAGTGISSSVSVWIGEDVPAAPTNVVLAATDMDATVTWEAPTAGIHDGYFSGTGLTYDVVRFPGEVLVSDDQTELTFAETLPEAGSYYYEVTASNASGVGETEMSNSLVIGDFLLYEDFESGASLWTQEQVGDGVWTFQAGGTSGYPATAYEGENNAYCGHVTTGNTTKLISPEVLVSSNDFYKLKFWMAQVNWSGDQDQLKVYYKSGVAGEWLELASYENEVATWTEESLIFYSEEAPYIAFEGIDGYGYGNCVDFVTVIESDITCLNPISLTATNITASSVELGWTSNGDLWNIEYGMSGFTMGEGTTIEGITDNPYTLSGLDAETTYDFYIQTDCGVNGTSNWAGPFEFTTEFSCVMPTDLTATGATTSSVVLGWTSDGDLWNIEYGMSGFVMGEGTTVTGVTENPYTLNDLNAGTAYDFYVQSNCGDVDGTSEWAGPFMFATACDIISIFPYTEGFEIAVPPVCWSMLDEDGDGFNWEQTGSTSATTHGGDFAAMSASWDATDEALTPDNYLITPQFEISADNLELSFWVAAQDPTYPAEYYAVMVSTTDTNPASFTEIYNNTLSSDEWSEVVLPLAAYNGENIYIAFRHYNVTDQFQMKIDDFKIDFATSLEANITETVNVYPNPTTGLVNISNVNDANISVINMLGQVVYSTVATSNVLTIDASSWKQGTYLVRIVNNEEVNVIKLDLVK